MKNALNYVVCLALLSAGNLYAQKADSKLPKNISLEEVKLQLSNDLNKQMPETKNSKVLWESTTYGYRATYSYSNLDYMTLYDTDGNYLETLQKTPWDDRVPAILKMELGNSEFNTSTVETYWEKIHTEHPEYYMELTDRDGKAQYIWSDENGTISVVPVFKR
jgi:hypothetical protein